MPTRSPFCCGLRLRALNGSLQTAIEDLDVRLIRAFLEHIEEGRANTVRSRTARLAAIKAFFRFLEPRRPACLEQAMMIRALPVKRTDAKLIDYLTKAEMRAVLAAPDTRGQRQIGGQGLFRPEDNLESPYARDALR